MGINPGSAALDSAPPSPPDRVFPSQAQPGDDTRSLLGADQPNNNDNGSSLQSAGQRLLVAAAMFMQAANLATSVAPGAVPPPILQWIETFRQQAPQVASQMMRQGDPMAMLSAAGASGNGAPGGAPPMATAAMSGGAGPGGPGGGSPQDNGRPY